jgi:fucose permease
MITYLFKAVLNDTAVRLQDYFLTTTSVTVQGTKLTPKSGIIRVMYPIAMNYASLILPRRILTDSIGWISGFGQAGSALFPFITGAITSKKGIQSLQPL